MTITQIAKLSAEYATLKALKGGWCLEDQTYAESRMETISNKFKKSFGTTAGTKIITDIQQGISVVEN
jgi:hypothetical protein